MDLIQRDMPSLIMQHPALINANGFDYCPFETVQIAHNGAHHWVLLSSLKGMVTIYDSVNMKPTESLIKQLTQLFSPDSSVPAYQQVQCIKQYGSFDCGIFAIAYAIDILQGNDPHQITYDQSKMRNHLVCCFEQKTLHHFPTYNITKEKPVYLQNDISSQWIIPRRSQRLKKQNKTDASIYLSNHFENVITSSTNDKHQSKNNDRFQHINKYNV